MIKPIILAALMLGIAGAAHAQPSDAAMLGKALTILQEQREAANNATVNSEARARALADENAQLKAQVKSLQDELAKAKDNSQ